MNKSERSLNAPKSPQDWERIIGVCLSKQSLESADAFYAQARSEYDRSSTAHRQYIYSKMIDVGCQFHKWIASRTIEQYMLLEKFSLSDFFNDEAFFSFNNVDFKYTLISCLLNIQAFGKKDPVLLVKVSTLLCLLLSQKCMQGKSLEAQNKKYLEVLLRQWINGASELCTFLCGTIIYAAFITTRRCLPDSISRIDFEKAKAAILSIGTEEKHRGVVALVVHFFNSLKEPIAFSKTSLHNWNYFLVEVMFRAKNPQLAKVAKSCCFSSLKGLNLTGYIKLFTLIEEADYGELQEILKNNRFRLFLEMSNKYKKDLLTTIGQVALCESQPQDERFHVIYSLMQSYEEVLAETEGNNH